MAQSCTNAVLLDILVNDCIAVGRLHTTRFLPCDRLWLPPRRWRCKDFVKCETLCDFVGHDSKIQRDTARRNLWTCSKFSNSRKMRREKQCNVRGWIAMVPISVKGYDPLRLRVFSYHYQSDASHDKIRVLWGLS